MKSETPVAMPKPVRKTSSRRRANDMAWVMVENCGE